MVKRQRAYIRCGRINTLLIVAATLSAFGLFILIAAGFQTRFDARWRTLLPEAGILAGAALAFIAAHAAYYRAVLEKGGYNGAVLEPCRYDCAAFDYGAVMGALQAVGARFAGLKDAPGQEAAYALFQKGMTRYRVLVVNASHTGRYFKKSAMTRLNRRIDRREKAGQSLKGALRDAVFHEVQIRLIVIDRPTGYTVKRMRENACMGMRAGGTVLYALYITRSGALQIPAHFGGGWRGRERYRCAHALIRRALSGTPAEI